MLGHDQDAGVEVPRPERFTLPPAETPASVEARFTQALGALPTPYKAFLVAVAFHALNDIECRESLARQLGGRWPELRDPGLLLDAAGVFLDLEAVMQGQPWPAALREWVDVERALNGSDWLPPFTG